MHRRAYLLSALTAASTITAGCGSPSENDPPSDGDSPSDGDPFESRTEHTNPTVETGDSPQETAKYLEFHGDGVDLPTVGVDPGGGPPPSNFLTTISHSENTELRSLTQRFAPSDGDGTPLRLSGQASFTGDPDPRPSVSVSNDGQTAVVEVQQFDELADETVFMSLPVTQWPESVRRLVVKNTVELVKTNSLNQIHVLKGQLEFEFTGETETNE